MAGKQARVSMDYILLQKELGINSHDLSKILVRNYKENKTTRVEVKLPNFKVFK